MRVLVAEGCEPVRERLVAMVRESSGLTLAGDSPTMTETLSLIQQCEPELLVIGNTLRDGSGFDLLKGCEKRVGRTVIMLCEQLNASYLYNARLLGADYVLELPRDAEVLPRLLQFLAANAERQAVRDAERQSEPFNP